MLDLIIAGRLDGLVLGPRHADLHHALRAAVHGARDEFVQRHVGVAQRAPQHRHVDAGDDARAHAVGHRQRRLAGRGAEDVGQDQHLGGRQRGQRRADLRLRLGRAGAGGDVDAQPGRRRSPDRRARATASSDVASGAWATSRMAAMVGFSPDYRHLRARRAKTRRRQPRSTARRRRRRAGRRRPRASPSHAARRSAGRCPTACRTRRRRSPG